MSYPNNPQVPQPVYAPQQPQYAPPPQQQYQPPQQPQAPQAPQGRYVPPRRGRALSTGHVNAISWKDAQPGDMYEGHFIRLERSNYEPYNHGIVLETGDGTEILLRGTGRLQSFLKNHRPQPGQYFVFTMLGKERIAKGKFTGSQINEFDIQIIDENDKSKEERFLNLSQTVNAEYAIITSTGRNQPQQMPYGQQAYAQPPPQYAQQYAPQQYAPQPQYAQPPPQQYAPQPAYTPQPPAPVYAPQPPAPVYAPQPPPQQYAPQPTYAPQQPQQQPQPAYVPPYNPSDIPF